MKHTEHVQPMRDWLHQQDMTQAELARRLDFNPNYVYMVARGDRPLSSGFRLRFRDCFGFDPADRFANGAEHDHA